MFNPSFHAAIMAPPASQAFAGPPTWPMPPTYLISTTWHTSIGPDSARRSCKSLPPPDPPSASRSRLQYCPRDLNEFFCSPLRPRYRLTRYGITSLSKVALNLYLQTKLPSLSSCHPVVIEHGQLLSLAIFYGSYICCHPPNILLKGCAYTTGRFG
jgi:hypothetical protein